MTGLRNALGCVMNTVQQRWMTKWPKEIHSLASMNKTEIKIRGANIFQNSSSHLKILGAREVTRSNFHIESPHILGTTNSVITTTRARDLGTHDAQNIFSQKRRFRKLILAPRLLKRTWRMADSNLTLDSDHPC
jgi:hypothetical protein